LRLANGMAGRLLENLLVGLQPGGPFD